METMQRCGGCRRHVRATEERCPFCGGHVGLVMVWPARWVVIALVGALAGCTDRAVPGDDGEGDATNGESTTDASAGTTMPGTSVGTTMTTGFTTSTTDATSGPFDTGVVDTSSEVDTGVMSAGFIYGDPDTGGVDLECDVWAQDCPDGEKCVPWANDGGNVWNATRCSPVEPMPAAPGEACQVEGSPFSGIDTCALGSFCWDVDVETLEGVCVGQCGGNEANPDCPPDLGCLATGESVIAVCLAICDPLAPACVGDDACAPWADTFFCVPDGSGEEGQHGDACEYINACDPGLFCANPEGVPDCMGSPGCCTEFCDTTIAADQQCSGVAGGEECVAWFEDGEAPQGLENLGACVIPP